MTAILWLVLALSLCVCGGLGVALGRTKQRAQALDAEMASLQDRFAPVLSLDDERARVIEATQRDREQGSRDVAQAQREVRDHHAQLGHLRHEIDRLTHQRDGLVRHVALLDEESELQSFGFYKPRYGFAESGAYERRLKQVRGEQAQMVKAGRAAVCHREWTVDGSAAKGKKMISNNIKLMLRAFHGECDAAISKVRYNNVDVMQRRIERACEAINKMMANTQFEVGQTYLSLKLQELYLVHEYAERRRAEKEEQRRIKEQMREEAQAQREIERAMSEAAREEERYDKALERARAEFARASQEKHAALRAQIELLEVQLVEARERNQRALSMAQQTRAGHVYIISNVGSFGDGIYKIGMTRRLDPLDRVKELGDASVPFGFDIHAMIYSEDAPALESELHRVFDHARLNKVNNRKEFFRVSMAEIERHVRCHTAAEIEFTHVAEAEEYRKSHAIHAEAHRPQPHV